MINIFKKKQKECKHKYKDFPWYISYKKEENKILPFYRIEIIEPYVCLLCKKRIDKVLSFIPDVDEEKVDEIIKDLQKKYGSKIEDITIVEDMVNDCQLVDKSFIESYEYSQKITEDIMKSMHEDKYTSGNSNNDDLMALVNEIKNNLQVIQKG